MRLASTCVLALVFCACTQQSAEGGTSSAEFESDSESGSESGEPPLVWQPVLGADEEIGALMSVWGLPINVVESIAYHHEPANHPDPASPFILAVHVASALATEIDLSEHPENGLQERVDTGYLVSIGMDDKLPEWRAIAAEFP